MHAYRFEDKRKALEIANHLRQAHDGLIERQQQAEENRAPIEVSQARVHVQGSKPHACLHG